MKYNELASIDNPSVLRFPLKDFSEYDNKCIVSGWIPLEITALSSAFKRADTHSMSVDDIPVVDPTNKLLGYVCVCTALGAVDPADVRITDKKYVAYINEIGFETFATGTPFRFEKDYIVLDLNYYEEYQKKYLRSAPLWGGFLHETKETPLPRSYASIPQQLIAVPNIALPTIHHIESAGRSVAEAFGFERFLKLYHLLELLFDYEIVENIRSLKDDLQGIGQLLTRFENSNELFKLRSLLYAHCNDINSIEACLNRLVGSKYLDKAREIFFAYGKSENPLKDKEVSFFSMMQTDGFSIRNLKSHHVTTISSKDPKKYDELIIHTAAYCKVYPFVKTVDGADLR